MDMPPNAEDRQRSTELDDPTAKKDARAEKREIAKLRLEYVKTIAAVASLVAIAFGVLQWQIANTSSTLSFYQRLAAEWRENLRIVFDQPDIRPYFADKQPMDEENELRDKILAYADLRLDTMDAILTYAHLQGSWALIDGWRATFIKAFLDSPVLCLRFDETRVQFGLLQALGESACNAAKLRSP